MKALDGRMLAVLLFLSLVLMGAGSIRSLPTRAGLSDWTPVLPDDFESEYPLMVTIQGGASGGTGYVVDLIWNQTAGPPAMNITEDGMKLNFTPSAPGEHTFEMRVLDSNGNESENIQVNITVVPNHAPTIVEYNSTLTIDEDADLILDISQWVEDNDEELTFSLNHSEPGLEVNPMGFGSFQIIPDDDLNGVFDLSFKVVDEFNNTILLEAYLVINAVPDAPHFTFINGNEVLVGTQDVSGSEDTEIVFNFTIEDPDLKWGGDELTLTSDQGSIQINGTTATLLPAMDYYGSLIITFTVTDAYGLFENLSVVLDIENVNDEPILNISGISSIIEVSEEMRIDFTKCVDPDGDTLTFQVSIDGGNWIEAQNFHIHKFTTKGNHTVDLKVDDGNGGVKEASYTVKVVDAIPDDDDILPPDDDDITDDDTDDDDTSTKAFSADPVLVGLLSVIAVLAMIFITLLILTFMSKGKKKDHWEDFDDSDWE